MLCAVLEMERVKSMEEERMQNELRQRKKMEKERKREELARQKEKEELRKREEEEEEGVYVHTQERKRHTHHINSNKPHLHTMCQLVSHGCLLYIVPEDPTLDRTSCICTRITAKSTHFMSLCSSILGYCYHFLLSLVPSLPSEGESTTGDEDEGDEPLRTDKPGKANRCT